jgi:hypothetical protein
MKILRLATVVLCLPILGCYEEPVRDHLHLVFSPGPPIVVTAVRDIAAHGTAGDNSAVEDRLDEARTDIEGGWDRWSRGFAELGAVADRTTVERHGGETRRGIHSALLESFRPLERLLANEGLETFYDDRGAGERVLELRPASTGQASRQQREHLAAAVDEWSADVAAYLEAATALYAYLDRAPDRALPCLAHLFDDQPEGSGPLGEGEERLVETVKQRMEAVAAVLLIDEGQAYSLNELSRLVHDTFQGRLTITVDGPVLEIAGLVEHPTFVERPPVDLWRALEGLTGRWLAPDLVTAMVAPGPDSAQPDPDPAIFAAEPRRWAAPPDAAEVAAELRARLRPEELYLVRWQTPPAPDDEDELATLALGLLADAERSLPD